MIRSGPSIGRPRIIAFTIVNIVPFMPIPSANARTAGKVNRTSFNSRRAANRRSCAVSWNHLVQNNKTFGIGWTSNVTARVTLHHNWFQNTNSRNPSADNIALCHMYNNYLQDITGYGNYVRGLTKAGLPVGLHLVGPRYADALVLRAARAFESTRPIRMPSV